jgi:hypothetical protein
MKINEFKLEFVTIFLLIMIPYKSLGDELSTVIVALLCSIVFVKHVKNIKINKYYIFSLVALTITAIISMMATNNVTKSLSGLCLYIVFLVGYLFFSTLTSIQEQVIKFIVYVICGFSLIYIIIQGGIYNERIDGNIGYANTYALILLIALYLNQTIKTSVFYLPCELILFIGIFYTSSRNTMVYLIVFIIIKFIYDFKEKYKFSVLINATVAFFSYAAIQLMGFGMILVLPILIYCFYYIIMKNMKPKFKNVLAIILILLSIPLVFLLPINFVQRLKNLSFSLGVFQERLVYFNDVIPVIFKRLIGSGINSFEYTEYLHQTAFYDVRYIHNSVLQIGYDIGLFGALLFIVIAVIGLFILIKSKNENKKYFIPIYITIYLHSMLDFDFSYVTIVALLVMFVAFSNDTQDEKLIVININKLMPVTLILFTSYLVFVQANYYFGNILIQNNNLNTAEKLYNINKNITFKDPEVYSQIAELYKLKSKQIDKALLKECVNNLKKSQEINPVDPRTIGNLAFTYQALGQSQEAIDAYENFLNIQPYYSKMYEVYYNYLKELYKNTGDEYYINKIRDLRKKFEASLANLNPKAKYMKDQLPKSFEDL